MIDPFPTIFRAVSGSVTASMQRLMLDSIARVQKIQGHPAYWTSMPPKTGPMLGAAFGLEDVNQDQLACPKRDDSIPQ